MPRFGIAAVCLIALAGGFSATTAARAATLVTGMNIVNPQRAKIDDQNALIAQLHAAGVQVVRCGITNDDKGIDLAQRLKAAGIAIELILSPKYPPDAPKRAYQPQKYPEMWGGPPLSYADPHLSHAYYASLFAKLEAAGIPIVGFELGNELNWTAFNPEFPLPGEGKSLGLDDLYHDPEGQQIAKGFVQYLKILRELKTVRDASQLYAHTPIITAGFVDAGPAGPRKSVLDNVALDATLAFLRANGLDDLVDAYGVHTYPSGKLSPAAAKQRLYDLTLAACRPPGVAGGKPCWITEWGFPNADKDCPIDDAGRAALVREYMGFYHTLADTGRLAGVMLFSWDSDPWSKTVDRDSVYRCGALTSAGQAALH